MSLMVHAILLADRLHVDRSSRDGVVSTAPFCYREGDGYVVIFRYGVAVLIGLDPAQEERSISELRPEATPPSPPEEERAAINILPEQEQGFAADGRLQIKELTAAHVLVIADILAKSVALARYEREIAGVLDTIEPAADALAIKGRIPRSRKALLQLIGSALLAQHRVSGRIAFAEKPDILWEHPELERFYARLEDEYEIVERGTVLDGKVRVEIGRASCRERV